VKRKRAPLFPEERGGAVQGMGPFAFLIRWKGEDEKNLRPSDLPKKRRGERRRKSGIKEKNSFHSTKEQWAI